MSDSINFNNNEKLKLHSFHSEFLWPQSLQNKTIQCQIKTNCPNCEVFAIVWLGVSFCWSHETAYWAMASGCFDEGDWHYLWESI